MSKSSPEEQADQAVSARDFHGARLTAAEIEALARDLGRAWDRDYKTVVVDLEVAVRLVALAPLAVDDERLRDALEAVAAGYPTDLAYKRLRLGLPIPSPTGRQNG